MFLYEDRQNRPATYVGAALIAAMIILYLKPVYDSIGGTTIQLIYDIIVPILAGTCTVLSFLVARSYSPGEILRRIWLFLGVGLLLWTIGEVVWAINELILNIDPYPSYGDIAWIVGYVPLFIALWLRFRSLQATPERERVIPILILFVALVIAATIFIFIPIFAEPDIAPFELLVDVLYPVGDLALALGALLIVMVLTGGKLSRPWILIVAGFLIVAVADLFYTYADWQGIYTAGESTNLVSSIADVTYYISYVVIALGLYLQARIQKIL